MYNVHVQCTLYWISKFVLSTLYMYLPSFGILFLLFSPYKLYNFVIFKFQKKIKFQKFVTIQFVQIVHICNFNSYEFVVYIRFCTYSNCKNCTMYNKLKLKNRYNVRSHQRSLWQIEALSGSETQTNGFANLFNSWWTCFLSSWRRRPLAPMIWTSIRSCVVRSSVRLKSFVPSESFVRSCIQICTLAVWSREKWCKFFVFSVSIVKSKTKTQHLRPEWSVRMTAKKRTPHV